MGLVLNPEIAMVELVVFLADFKCKRLTTTFVFIGDCLAEDILTGEVSTLLTAYPCANSAEEPDYCMIFLVVVVSTMPRYGLDLRTDYRMLACYCSENLLRDAAADS